jgi:hypothetical protein
VVSLKPDGHRLLLVVTPAGTHVRDRLGSVHGVWLPRPAYCTALVADGELVKLPCVGAAGNQRLCFLAFDVLLWEDGQHVRVAGPHVPFQVGGLCPLQGARASCASAV